MSLYSFHTDPDSLLHSGAAHDAVPHLVWDRYKNKPAELKKREAALAVDPEHACKYARYVLERPWPAGEAVIAQAASVAYQYAQYVLKGPFPAGEAAIAKDADRAREYAKLMKNLKK